MLLNNSTAPTNLAVRVYFKSAFFVTFFTLKKLRVKKGFRGEACYQPARVVSHILVFGNFQNNFFNASFLVLRLSVGNNLQHPKIVEICFNKRSIALFLQKKNGTTTISL